MRTPASPIPHTVRPPADVVLQALRRYTVWAATAGDDDAVAAARAALDAAVQRVMAAMGRGRRV